MGELFIFVSVVKMVNFCFSGEHKEFIGINKFGASWTNDQNKNMTCLLINPI